MGNVVFPPPPGVLPLWDPERCRTAASVCGASSARQRWLRQVCSSTHSVPMQSSGVPVAVPCLPLLPGAAAHQARRLHGHPAHGHPGEHASWHGQRPPCALVLQAAKPGVTVSFARACRSTRTTPPSGEQALSSFFAAPRAALTCACDADAPACRCPPLLSPEVPRDQPVRRELPVGHARGPQGVCASPCSGRVPALACC